jgi:hypothetical protein
MGTLTEVDVQTSGSFTSTFSAENLGSSASTINGTSGAALTVNLPTGGISLAIPSVAESFNASPFDGTADDAGTSGKQFAPVTSSSGVQTSVFTSPSALAAFTGNFRIPVTVSGHATGVSASTNGDASSSFNTKTSVTVTVIYHYTPSLPSLDPPSSGSGSQSPPASTSGNGDGNAAAPATSTPAGPVASTSGSTGESATAAVVTYSSSKAKKHTPKIVAAPKHKAVKVTHKVKSRAGHKA